MGWGKTSSYFIDHVLEDFLLIFNAFFDLFQGCNNLFNLLFFVNIFWSKFQQLRFLNLVNLKRRQKIRCPWESLFFTLIWIGLLKEFINTLLMKNVKFFIRTIHKVSMYGRKQSVDQLLEVIFDFSLSLMPWGSDSKLYKINWILLSYRLEGWFYPHLDLKILLIIGAQSMWWSFSPESIKQVHFL